MTIETMTRRARRSKLFLAAVRTLARRGAGHASDAGCSGPCSVCFGDRMATAMIAAASVSRVLASRPVRRLGWVQEDRVEALIVEIAA